MDHRYLYEFKFIFVNPINIIIILLLLLLYFIFFSIFMRYFSTLLKPNFLQVYKHPLFDN